MEENKSEKKPIIQTSCFIDKSNHYKLYEQLMDGTYATYDESTKTIKKELSVETSRYIFYPINSKVTNVNAIKLPATASDYESTEKLIEEILGFAIKYLDVSPNFMKLCAWYALMTWIKDNLNTVSYLRVLGDWGKAKTRWQDVFGGLCYKPIPFAGAINPAPLYRLMDAWNGTLLLDECVLQSSDEANYIIQILNSGIQRGKYVWRCDQDNVKEVEPFDPFGPKLIASRIPFSDNALESRCITEEMKTTERIDIPIDLPKSFFAEQRIIRNKLLMFRFRNWKQVDSNVITEIKLPECTKRLQQMIAPFAVSFFRFPKIIEDLNSFIIKYHIDQTAHNAASLEGGIVNAIFELWIKGNEQISSRLILKQMKEMGYELGAIKDSTIGRIRSGMGIKSKQIRVEGVSQMSIVWDDELMESLMKRYVGVEDRKHIRKGLIRLETRNKMLVEREHEIKGLFTEKSV